MKTQQLNAADLTAQEYKIFIITGLFLLFILACAGIAYYIGITNNCFNEQTIIIEWLSPTPCNK